MALTKEQIEDIIARETTDNVGVYYEDGAPAILYGGDLETALSDLNDTINRENNSARWKGESQYFEAARDDWARRCDGEMPGQLFTTLLTKDGVLSVAAILAARASKELVAEHIAGKVSAEFKVPKHLIDLNHTLKYRFYSVVDHSLCVRDDCKNIVPDDKLVKQLCPSCVAARRATYEPNDYDTDDEDDMEELAKDFPVKYLERMWQHNMDVNLSWISPGEHGWYILKSFENTGSGRIIADDARGTLDQHTYYVDGTGYALEAIVGVTDNGSRGLYVRWDDSGRSPYMDATVAALNVLEDDEDLGKHF
jgi:hypothetical protein